MFKSEEALVSLEGEREEGEKGRRAMGIREEGRRGKGI